MKKAISVVLCLLLTVCSISAFAMAFAAETKVEPVIICMGYSGCNLIMDKGEATEKQVWHVDIGAAVDSRKQDLLNSITSSVKSGNIDSVVDELGTAIQEELEYMKVNPDGSSTYNLSVFSTDPAETNVKAMKANGNESYMGETDLANALGAEIGEENIFIFQEDWRMSQMVISDELDKYIDDVLEYTGAQKVKLFGLSHGGQVVTFYCNRYGLNGKVSKCVASVPATCGTYLVPDLLTLDTYNFDVAQILDFVEKGFKLDLDYDILLKAFDFKTINEIFRRVVQDYAIDIIQYFGSIWDFVPVEEYEGMKAQFLTDPACAPFIETLDKSHNDYMAKTAERLQAVQKSGVDISIISGSNHELATGTQINTDYIIDVTDCTGAVTAPLGKKFDSDYIQAGTQCNNDKHYHISPAFDIDASTCYLPDNTWFSIGDYHGLYYFNPYTRDLIMKLLLTDEIKDVWSDKNYPQFNASELPGYEVYGQFDNSGKMYHTDGDLSFVVKNIAEENSETITAITVNGTDMSFSLAQNTKLKPGESVSVPIEFTKISETKPFDVTISFFYIVNNVPVYRTRTITYMQAEKAFASEHPYVINVTNTGKNPTSNPGNTTTSPTAPASKNPNTESMFENNGKPFACAIVAVCSAAMAGTIVVVRKKREN